MKTEQLIKLSFQYLLAVIIVVGFFSVLLKLIDSESNHDITLMIVGALVGAFATIVGFFFGSSKSSEDKNEMITNNNKAPNSVIK